MEKIEIYTEFITLGQFLKLSGIINNGGEAKIFIEMTEILVSNELEKRRGRKLREGDVVELLGKKYLIVKKNEN